MDRNGTWAVPEIVTSIDNDGRTVTIAAKRGKRAVVGFKEKRIAFPHDSLATAVLEAIDSDEDSIHETVRENGSYNQSNNIQVPLSEEETVFKTVTACHYGADFSDENAPLYCASNN